MASQWTISHHKQPAHPPAPSHMAPGCTETQRSQETVGLVPPSVSVVGNLPAVPKNASDTQHSAFINTQPETKTHACRQTHMYSQSHPLFPLHPSSRSSHLVWSKAFPVHLLSLVNDFQTSPVIRWRADGSWSRICLEKPHFGLNKVAVLDSRPGSLPGQMWGEIEPLH